MPKFAGATSVLVLLLCACGGSSQSNSGGSSGGGGSAGGVSLPSAPPTALEANALINAAGLSQALGTSFLGVQDEGGASIGLNGQSSVTEFDSRADTRTSSVRLSITLSTYGSTSQASQAYPASASGQPLTGIGDQASAQGNPKLDPLCNNFAADTAPNIQTPCLQQLNGFANSPQDLNAIFSSVGAVSVLKGAQILKIAPRITADGAAELGQLLSSANPSWDAVSSVIRGLETSLPQGAARALVAKMTGQAATGTYYQLPAGGINPCLATPSELQAQLSTTVTATPALPFAFSSGVSAPPPLTECEYTLGSDYFTVDLTTSTQAEAALQPVDLQSVFDKDAARAPYKMSATLDGGVTVQVIASGGELSFFEELISGLSDINAASYESSDRVVLTDAAKKKVLVKTTPVRARSGGENVVPKECSGTGKGTSDKVSKDPNFQNKKQQVEGIIDEACKTWGR